ncbi:MAG TPA: hypothetical protein VF701_13155 [Thermoanaerobaculia bacterium]
MTSAEERIALLLERAERWRREELIAGEVLTALRSQLVTGWRSNGLIVQAVFFVLTMVGIGAFYALSRSGLVTGAGSLALGEYLIRERRYGRTGVEAALWLGGLLALVTELPRTGSPEALLVLAAAAGIAAFRVRNPLFGFLAAIFVMIWFESRFDLGFLFAVVLSALSMILLGRRWERPSTEWLWCVTAVGMPLAAWFVAGPVWRTVSLGLYAVLGTLALTLAVIRRHHAMFAVAGVGFASAAVLAAQLARTPPELAFGLGGGFLLALAWLVSRALRDRTEGFVLAPLNVTAMDEVLEIGGSVVAATQTSQTAPTDPETRPVGGGGFGGAGATGEF